MSMIRTKQPSYNSRNFQEASTGGNTEGRSSSMRVKRLIIQIIVEFEIYIYIYMVVSGDGAHVMWDLPYVRG
jgi:hypothetical protein